MPISKSPLLAMDTTDTIHLEPDISNLVIDDDSLGDWFDPELEPDISNLVIEDDRPVDNIFSAKLQRLLVEILYTSWGKRNFFADANVGVFFALKQPPLVPDMFLAVDVENPPNLHEQKHRTYLVWEFGKSPDVVVEIVSNRKGHELDSKLRDYARIGVTYYVVFDPLEKLGTKLLYIYVLREGHYEELAAASGGRFWLPQVELGLQVWQGSYEGTDNIWLRWCDRTGNLLPTGAEQKHQAQQKLEQEKQKIKQARQKIKQEKQRADQAEARAAELLARLRDLGF